MGRGAKKLLLFMVILLTASVLFLELRLKPVAASVASVQAKAFATDAINESVGEILEEMNITGDDLETVTALADGSLSSINTNTVLTNKLKNLITLRSQEAISNIRSKRVDVPLGTILGGELLNGTGPCIPVYISMTGNVSSDFECSFESGGINQTVHKLSVNITAEINIIMPMNSCSEIVTTTVLVGETVIIGNTPGGMILKE